MSQKISNTANLKPSTIAVHAGEFVDPVTRASSPNLVMSSTFLHKTITGFSARALEEETGFVYGREGSPTVKQLEDKLAALEGGEAALCFASGLAATHSLIAGRLSSGDHLIMPESNYVGIGELSRDTLPRFGIETSHVDMSDLAAIAAAIKPNTKMIWIETPSNPTMMVTDIAAVATLAHARGVRDVVVDSTFAPPMCTKPLELGADFVMHSLTKYIGGHGDAMGGAIIGRAQDIADLNLEANVHFGGILSPFNAWLIMRGAATLPLRIKAHQEGALYLAQKLEAHPAIKHVFYPGLPSHPQHLIAKRQMKNFSGMLTFQTHENGPAVGKRMIEMLQFIHYAVSLGHHRSLVCWIGTDAIDKSSYKHGAEALARYRSYTGDGVFRLSVGIEDGQDLWNDLVQCF